MGYDTELLKSNELIKIILSSPFIQENFKKYKKISKKNKNFIVNPTLNQIKKINKFDIFIFTYDFFINNGIFPEFNENYFSTLLFKNIINKGINKVNNNINKLEENSFDFGFSVSKSGLSIFYYQIKDFKTFLLENQLDGPTKEFNPNEIYDSISETMSQMILLFA